MPAESTTAKPKPSVRARLSNARVDHEAHFRRSGLPLFVEGYSARTDVFTRAIPLFSLVFLAEVFGAIDLDWSLATNAAAVAGGVLVILIALMLLNLARDRPLLARPEEVGNLELALFVLVPALLPIIFGFQWVSAAVTAMGNLVLILVILLIAYGLP